MQKSHLNKYGAGLLALALTGCADTPSCGDSAAVKMLANSGRTELTDIVTISVDEKAHHVTCAAKERGIVAFRYIVFRSSTGDIVVHEPD